MDGLRNVKVYNFNRSNDDELCWWMWCRGGGYVNGGSANCSINSEVHHVLDKYRNAKWNDIMETAERESERGEREQAGE